MGMTITEPNGNIHSGETGRYQTKVGIESVGVGLVPVSEDRDESAELTQLVEDEYEGALAAHREADEVMDRASVNGTADERAMFGLVLDSVAADLDVASRRRDAVRLAGDRGYGADRPARSEFANPTSLTQLRKAAADIKAGRVRGLIINSASAAKLDYKGIEIAPPKDSPPVFVEVQSGFAPLKVTRGTVVVDAGSWFGNSVTVSPGATAVVLAGEDCKVSTITEGTGVTVLVGAFGAHGLQSQIGTGGHLDMIDAGDLHTARFSPTV